MPVSCKNLTNCKNLICYLKYDFSENVIYYKNTISEIALNTEKRKISKSLLKENSKAFMKTKSKDSLNLTVYCGWRLWRGQIIIIILKSPFGRVSSLKICNQSNVNSNVICPDKHTDYLVSN